MLSQALGHEVAQRVILVDHNRHVGSDMGEAARPVIEDALAANHVDTMTAVGVTAVDARRIQTPPTPRLRRAGKSGLESQSHAAFES